jgi:hypothetical protein
MRSSVGHYVPPRLKMLISCGEPSPTIRTPCAFTGKSQQNDGQRLNMSYFNI